MNSTFGQESLSNSFYESYEADSSVSMAIDPLEKILGAEDQLMPLLPSLDESIFLQVGLEELFSDSSIVSNQLFSEYSADIKNKQPDAEGEDPLLAYGFSSTVGSSISIVQEVISNAADSGDLDKVAEAAFGKAFDSGVLDELFSSENSNVTLPEIHLLSDEQMNGAQGAYSSELNIIYLSKDFIVKNKDRVDSIASVILEELGHYLDFHGNQLDSAGDEGAIFSALIQNKSLSSEEMSALMLEDDFGYVMDSNQAIAVEQSNLFNKTNLSQYWSELKGDLTNLIVGDFNGDGKDDFLRQEKKNWEDGRYNTANIFFSHGKGFWKKNLSEDLYLHGNLTELSVGDFDGDGKDDLLRREKGNWADNLKYATANIFYSNFNTYGNGYFSKVDLPEYYQLRSDLSNVLVGDFNGDGRDDFLRQEKGHWDDDKSNTANIFYSRNNRYRRYRGFRKQTLSENFYIPGDMTNLSVGDFNGDGKSDLLRQEKGSWANNRRYATSNILFGNGYGGFTVKDLPEKYELHGDLSNIITGDFNGDGKDDFIRQEKSYWDNDWHNTANIYYNYGNGDFWKEDLSESYHLKGDLSNIIAGDFNGDGKDDFIRQEKGYWDNDWHNTANVFYRNNNTGLKGKIFGKNWLFNQETSHDISLERVSRGHDISSNRKTWVVLHGWNSNSGESNISDLSNALDGIDSRDQVFKLDWSSASNSFANLGEASSWIDDAARWAAKKLEDAGIAGSQINLIGHSLGAYVAAEIAKRTDRGVNRIIAFDAAANLPGGYNSESTNFRQHSKSAWAFHTSAFGNANVATTADASFSIGFGPWGGAYQNHGRGLQWYATTLRSNDKISRYFKPDQMHSSNPWKSNQFNSLGTGPIAGRSVGQFEGRIEARWSHWSGRWNPTKFTYRSRNARWWQSNTTV